MSKLPLDQNGLKPKYKIKHFNIDAYMYSKPNYIRQSRFKNTISNNAFFGTNRLDSRNTLAVFKLKYKTK